MKTFLTISLMLLAPSIYASGSFINSIDDVKTCYIYDKDNLLIEEQKKQLEGIGYIFITDESVVEQVHGDGYLPYYIPFIGPFDDTFGFDYQNEYRSGVHTYFVYLLPKGQDPDADETIENGVNELLSFGVCKVN